MDHFEYKNGGLHAEDVDLTEIAEKVGTPFYCYSTATLERHYKVLDKALSNMNHTICFAVKANPNIAVLKTLARLGSGADVVSEGEIRQAMAAGIPTAKIVFSGVGKSRGEIRFAIENNVGQFNVESVEELDVISQEAQALGREANIAIRINPDVDAETHDKISTGRKEDKFGVAYDDAKKAYKKAASLDGIKVVGVAAHIGSQITDLKPFQKAFEKIATLVEELKGESHDIKRIDLGGGLGVPYNNENPPAPKEYADMIAQAVNHLGCELVFEPGRLIAANAGILVASTVLVKKIPGKNFIVLDAAMNDLARPSLYDAYHEIVPVNENKGKKISADIVGPVCETGDVFGRDRKINQPEEGDLFAIRTAGAYGAAMAGTYNSRLLVPEIMVNGDRFAVIRERQTYQEMLERDNIPDWMK